MALKTSVRLGEARLFFPKAKIRGSDRAPREAMNPWKICGTAIPRPALQQAFKARDSLASTSDSGAKVR
jgi:hypothetical protein